MAENGLTSHLLRNYDVLDVLGAGAYGVVFHCRHRREGREYAIKVTKLIEADTDAYREVDNFLNVEKHPNIVKYSHCWDDSFSLNDISSIRNTFENTEHFKVPRGQTSFNAVCIQMELCGENLREWITNRGDVVEEEAAMHIFIQLVQGIQHLHNEGLFHRDLKPENVFFSRDNDFTIKVGDLGIATGWRRRRVTTAIGTQQYFAPEQEGNQYGKEVDIFALGIILLELLYPRMNESDDIHSSTLINLKYRRIVPQEVLERWPRAAELILRMVEINREDRPEFEEIFATFLKPIEQSEPSSSHSRQIPKPNNKGVNASNSNSSGYGSDCQQVPSASIQNRPSKPLPSVTIAESKEDFQRLLQTCNPGDTIELLSSEEYEGNFELKTSKITIDGKNAVVRGKNVGLSVIADRCILKNLVVEGETGIRVQGNGNALESIVVLKSISSTENKLPDFIDNDIGITLIGNYNLVRSVLASKRFHGAEVNGNSNTLDGFGIDGCTRFGIIVRGCNNTLSKILCEETSNGIWIKGDTNLVSGMSYNNVGSSSNFRLSRSGIAITIGSGFGNSVEKFENNVQATKYRYGIFSSSKSSSLTVDKSTVGKMYLEGSDHLVKNSSVMDGASINGSKSEFNDMNCGVRLDVCGRNHKFVNCTTNSGFQCNAIDVDIIGCNFY